MGIKGTVSALAQPGQPEQDLRAYFQGVEGGQARDRQQMEQDAALARLIKTKEMQDQASEIGRQRSLEDQTRTMSEAQRLASQYKGQPVTVGDKSVHIGGTPDMSRALERGVDNRRLETGAVTKAYEGKIGDLRDKTQALSEVEQLLNSPNPLTYGQLQNAMARMKEKGAMTEGDIARTLPSTLRRDVSKLGTYLGLTEDNNPLDPSIRSQAVNYVKSLRQLHEKRMGGAKKEVEAQSPFLAPTLHQSGDLPQVIQSLGVGMGTMSDDPQQDPASQLMERLKALEAKRAAAGVK